MIIPGILEKTAKEIQKKIKLIHKVSEIIQIDVADNILVSGSSESDPKKLKNLRALCPIELHLMVKNPVEYLEYDLTNFSKISAQIEGENINAFVNAAVTMGYSVGLSINPETPNSSLDEYLPVINYIQFMAVTPGAQGRDFNYEVLEKIKDFRNRHDSIEIQIDGHMDLETIPLFKDLGVNNYIVGSYIFGSKKPKQTKLELDAFLSKNLI